MKFTSTIYALLAVAATTAGSVSAFAPPASSSISRAFTTNSPVLSKSTPPSSSSLFLSDNTADNFKELQEKAQDKLPQFLYVDATAAQNKLANNWGWITASGGLTLALGTAALLMPVFASGVAYDATVLTLGASGIIGLINAVARENGHRAKSALSGALYLFTAYTLGTNPGAGLDIITLAMAASIGAEGVFETLLAAKNKDLNGRGWHFVSGVGSVIASVWLTTNMPVSSLFAPGAALGARLTSSGATKVAVGLEGKKLADSRKSKN